MSTGRGLTNEQANHIYDVLVKRAGAPEDGRDTFVYAQTRGHFAEYRFVGSLGLGGKFWRSDDRWYVSAYPEDLAVRPDRSDVVTLTNAALGGLRAAYIALAVALDEEVVL